MSRNEQEMTLKELRMSWNELPDSSRKALDPGVKWALWAEMSRLSPQNVPLRGMNGHTAAAAMPSMKAALASALAPWPSRAARVPSHQVAAHLVRSMCRC